MKVWITKYALTQGILTGEADDKSVDVAIIKPYGAFVDKDWHKTWKSAKARAEEMKAAKLKSLAKQTEKILYMKFENPEK